MPHFLFQPRDASDPLPMAFFRPRPIRRDLCTCPDLPPGEGVPHEACK